MAVSIAPELRPNQAYTWEELADAFGFKPGYFAVAGGMVPSRATDSLLLITHPFGGKSFDYKDYWDGSDLIYTGRGKLGPQTLEGQNLDVDQNRRTLLVFEAAGPRRLLFRGKARNVETRTGRAPDVQGAMRTVYLFRLRFERGSGASLEANDDARRSDEIGRRPRPFREQPPEPPQPARDPPDPEAVAAKAEQANGKHHALVQTLNEILLANGWDEVEEIPGAIDLWARRPDGGRTIFEAKTLTAINELSQTRSGFAQLHEYRLEYGAPDDELCLVVDRPLALRRQKLLDSLSVAVLVREGSDFKPGNDLGSRLLDLFAPTP